MIDTDLFRHLFKAREDVFAVRWEKERKVVTCGYNGDVDPNRQVEIAVIDSFF